VINIMTAVSQWEREAIGERTRDAMNHKKSNGQRVGNIAFGFKLAADGEHLEHDPHEQEVPDGDWRPASEALHVARDSGGIECSRLFHAAGVSLATRTRRSDRGAKGYLVPGTDSRAARSSFKC
jgi:hypothetical protein